MNFKILIIIVIFTFFLDSCNVKNRENEHRKIQEFYNVFINYNHCKNDIPEKDILVLFLETGFQNDSIEVFLNGKTIFNDEINTDISMGYAKHIELGKLMDVQEVYFRINNGTDIVLRNPRYNFIYANYFRDSLVDIQASNKFRTYR